MPRGRSSRQTRAVDEMKKYEKEEEENHVNSPYISSLNNCKLLRVVAVSEVCKTPDGSQKVVRVHNTVLYPWYWRVQEGDCHHSNNIKCFAAFYGSGTCTIFNQ